jgi:hypothetical protein
VIIGLHIFSGHEKLIFYELSLACSTFMFSCCAYFSSGPLYLCFHVVLISHMGHYLLVIIIFVTNHLSMHFDFTWNVRF